MRDPGLTEAINAAGGVTELARRIGISQPSVTNWDRVPADRVVAVEQATGVVRMRLRPDLYGEVAMGSDVDEIDCARAQEYALLAALLVRAPDADLLRRLTRLAGDGTPLGRAHQALADAAKDASAAKLEREYFDLFIGVGRGELLPYASYYLTGFLNERPLARVREDLNALGIERAEGHHDPEDHLAILCEVMAGLAAGRFEVESGAERRFFERHLKPWAARFFADLETARHARFYRPVGTIGRIFMEIEAQAFAMDA